MKSLKVVLFLLIVLLTACAGEKEEIKVVKVARGNIRAEISTTGIVEPRNYLEIKPSLAGRIEKVAVREGQKVWKGQTLIWMSSSDRAALLDAARSKGQAEVAYWEEVYKPTPIMAPLNGFIIERKVEPGQSVAASDALLVMADYLIVKAQVDETDIGKIVVGQIVEIELDAYAGKSFAGRVEHIAFNSTTVNNVNIYEVDVLLDKTPAFARAGMSATVEFVLKEKSAALLLPINAVKLVRKQSYVFLKGENGKDAKPVQIKTGMENSLNVEVTAGVEEGAAVVVPTVKMVNELKAKFERRRGPVNPFAKQKK